VTALERRIDLSGVDFCFSTLPTLWQTSNSVDYGFFDVVVRSRIFIILGPAYLV